MQPVLTISEMRDVDGAARSTTTLEELVARAGHSVATAALELLGGAYGRRIVLVCGPGNNGADGQVAARVLARRGAAIEIVDAGSRVALPACDLVIDAAYGTGFRGEYRAPAGPEGTPVLAVDIPSGVHGDTGECAGSPARADRTVTFAALKPGLLQGEGRARSGRVTVADIGLDVGDPAIRLVEDGDLASRYPPRPPGANKWQAAVLMVAGSPGMTGAAYLSARAAYRAGAGMVRLGVPGAALESASASEAVSIELPESGWSSGALEAAERCAAVVVGPGLGRSEATAVEVKSLLERSPVPVVVDADGLFALGRLAHGALSRARSLVVLTPHDGEYVRLMGDGPGPDRVSASRRLAEESGAVALCKGPTTAVAAPGGRVLLATRGTPALATAGTGDVLSGIIGALISRGVPVLEAAGFAAHLHGWAASTGRSEGLVAGDLPDLVSDVLGRCRGG
ncbi:MAG: NAD(P)H-hydrate dehydratase [Acidimicrobiales bacterium]